MTAASKPNLQWLQWAGQVVTAVASAAIVGIWVWLFNIAAEMRDFRHSVLQIARVEGELAAARSIIHRNSDRLLTIEAMLARNNEMHSDTRKLFEDHKAVMENMRSEIDRLREAIIVMQRDGGPPAAQQPRGL